MSLQGVKHMVRCNCILPHLKSSESAVFHQFIVFSTLKDNELISHHSQCNNCGAIHHVVDVCNSKIISGRDELRSIRTIDDIRLTIPNDIRDVLDSYGCDVATWEHVEFILDNEKWGSTVIIARDQIEDRTEGKQLVFPKRGKVKIEPFIINTNIV